MIWLTKVDGSPILVNVANIAIVEQAHDTIVTLTTGEKLRVEEAAQEIERRAARWTLSTSGWVPPVEAEGEGS